jgi:hypothetical protein
MYNIVFFAKVDILWFIQPDSYKKKETLLNNSGEIILFDLIVF